ncbi:MAG: LptF/LptG family permease [Balneolaceae bacterium]
MFNQIQRDLLKKHIGPFLFCFFTVMFILLMMFLIQHVDKLVGKGLDFMIVFELILNNLAYMVVLAAPMAVLVSTLMAFGQFSEWNELTAVKAAGVNPIQLLKPVVITSCILFLGLAYFSNEILPESNHKARSLFLDIRMKKPGFDLQPGVFYDGIEGYTFLVKEIPAETDSLYDVTLFQEESKERQRAFIKARKGLLVTPNEHTLSLFLEDGSIMRNMPGSRGGRDIEMSEFNRYRITFDLSELAFTRSNPEERNRNDRTMRAQAMLAYIDTLESEMQKEIQSFLSNHGDFRNIEADSYHRSFVPEIENAEDTVQVYHSSIETLNQVPFPEQQTILINQTISRLSSYRSSVDNLASNLNWRTSRVAEFTVEVHKKLAIPFACIIFVLLGAPIGMMTRKGNIGFAAIVGLVLLTFYFIAIIQGEKWADRLIISPFFGMWGINFFLGLAGILMILHISTSFKITRLLKRS